MKESDVNDELRTEFIVPAYGESQHLVACIESLKQQKDHSGTTISTSTMNPFIRAVANNFGIDVVEYPIQQGIGADWNNAMDASEAVWVTLAHQDDIYYPDYAFEVKQAIRENPDATIIFTSYDEIKDGIIISRSRLVKLKKWLLEFGFLGRKRISTPRAKTNCLRFGCAIPCPAVTLRRDPYFRFDENLKVNLDWDAWLRLAQSNGSFVWIRKPLMAHRLHDDQESTSAIRTGVRQREDLILLKRLWPSFLAHLIEKTYRLMR